MDVEAKRGTSSKVSQLLPIYNDTIGKVKLIEKFFDVI